MANVRKRYEYGVDAVFQETKNVREIILRGYQVIRPMPDWNGFDAWNRELGRFGESDVYDELFRYLEDACDFLGCDAGDADKISHVFPAIYIAVVYGGKNYKNWGKESFGFYTAHLQEINAFNDYLWDKIEKSRSHYIRNSYHRGQPCQT